MFSRNILIFSTLCLILFSCKMVKPYHQGRVNHSNMKLNANICEQNTVKSRTYREANHGMTISSIAGGCGCN